MTENEAIEIIKFVPLYRYECELEKCRQSDLFQALSLSIEALEKQMPKKMESYYCPICRHYFEDGEEHNYCPSCGQRLII